MLYNIIKKEFNIKLFLIPVIIFLGFFIFVVFMVLQELEKKSDHLVYYGEVSLIDRGSIKRFASEEEFNLYIAKAGELKDSYNLSPELFRDTQIIEFTDDVLIEEAESLSLDYDIAESVKDTSPERYSETNVQVEGIDEPDIVKTDGENIYTSFNHIFFRGNYPREVSETKIASVLPPEEMEIISEIEKGGSLLLGGDTLAIFQDKKITGYSVRDIENPEELWEINLDEKTNLADARLMGENIYMVFYTGVYRNQPCETEIFSLNDEVLSVSCTEIYYPGVVVPVDTTYTVASVNIKSGEKRDKVSFIGSRDNSVIYMSPENLYLSYFQQAQMIDFMTGFYREEGLLSRETIERLEKLTEYDISLRAKEVEMEVILEDYFASLSDDELMKLESEITNKIGDYYEKNRREMESTGIVKIGLKDMNVKAAGNVPGNLVNQFAMDEYKGNLRVATTIGERFRPSIRMTGRRIESTNDVYILDESLKKKSSVKDLGVDERIYAVRFMKDRGYVVTFREIDPFYVLDLSNPNYPKMKGELKIPGYSSYLHLINEDRVLGIGMEDWNVKASLFDVSDPKNPQEIDNYILSERWSEAVSNHHAFLIDRENKMFFLPAGGGGYIFSYKNDEINLERAIREREVKRALYINNYLYVISSASIIAIDQENWENVNKIDF